MSGVNGWLISLSEYIGGMSDELDNAKAENAKLRAMQDTWAENDAKLRELVRHMHTCLEHYETDGSVSCDRCPLDNDTGDSDYERRMRELWMGVDG